VEQSSTLFDSSARQSAAGEADDTAAAAAAAAAAQQPTLPVKMNQQRVDTTQEVTDLQAQLAAAVEGAQQREEALEERLSHAQADARRWVGRGCEDLP
jgi:polysaccharide deacetylase 2 family uncharacterized protein YibQ